jgi:hypothetical protein
MWPFNRRQDDTHARLTKLEAEFGAMRVSYEDSITKVLAVVQRVENRYQQASWQEKQRGEKDELREILGGVDIAAIMKDPDALKTALQNPQLIQFALKKFAKDLI